MSRGKPIFMNRTKQKVHQIKTTWTDEEFAQVQRIAEARKMPLGVCVHALVSDVLRSRLTRGETLLLEAVEELQANYLGVIQLQIDKQFSPAAFDEMVEQNRLQRRELAQEFLLTVPASESTPETDEDEDEDEDEGDE
jgi:hypothetical protein